MSVSSARSQPQQFSDFGRGSNLRDDVTFPVYADCPHENDIYLPYYKANHLSGIFKAARHWCFIGQVVDAFYMFRLTLVVRDKDGHDVSVWFYDDDRGSRFMDGRNCNVMGHTFVLLYAQRHPFMDGSEGFRIEEPEAIKFIPSSLQELLSANDSVHSPPSGQASCCAKGCEKTESLKRCSGCHFASYCSKEHQVADWKKHKETCKVMVSLQWFHNKDWETFHDYF